MQCHGGSKEAISTASKDCGWKHAGKNDRLCTERQLYVME
jgi:hypothetical protein